MEGILDRMKKSPLGFDGAMGTMIYERGGFINTRFDELSLPNPKLISQIHREYVEAGAEVIETNTFGANRIALRPYGLSEKVVEINRQAVRIAREAAGAPVLASCARTVRREPPVGMKAGAIARELSADGNVDAVGINCGTGPAGVFDALQSVLPQVAKPVAGVA